MRSLQILFLCLVIFQVQAWGQLNEDQQAYVDSAEGSLASKRSDTARLNTYFDLTYAVFSSSPSHVMDYCGKIIEIGEPQIDGTPKELSEFYRDKVAFAYNCMGIVVMNRGEYDRAVDYYETSIEHRKALDDLLGESKSLNNIGMIMHYTGRYPEAIEYYARSYEVYSEMKDTSKMASSLNNMAEAHMRMGDLTSAAKILQESYDLRLAINDVDGAASTLHNMGNLYVEIGDHAKAIMHYTKSLEIEESQNDHDGIAQTLLNIGYIYMHQEDYPKAMEYYERAIEMSKENNKHTYLTAITDMASAYFRMDSLERSNRLYLEALKICYEIEEMSLLGNTLHNMGTVHDKLGNVDSSMYYFEEGRKVRSSIDDKVGLVGSYLAIGGVNEAQGNLKEASRLYKEAYKMANEAGVLDELQMSTQAMYGVSKKAGNVKEALSFLELYIKYRDSAQSEANTRAVIQQEYQYQYAKQAAADSVKNAEQRKVQDALLVAERSEKEKHQLEAEQQRQRSYFLIGLVIIASGLGGLIFNRFRITKKQKVVIEEQKKTVDQAYGQLEEKNKEILDSISYAKRIQNAILPPAKVVKEYLSDSFILYKPKDIVAGDFYWMEQKGGKTLFAAADCTGHGVPGAMVSVVCNNGLNRSVREHGLTDPAEILNKTREIVIKEFEKSEEEVKDGMDIALCCLEGDTLKYAGANNPLWIVRNSKSDSEISEIEEIKADKQPIGKYMAGTDFTTHEVKLNKGDAVYIFSDGYADQFGGPKGKKFKSANFKRLILSLQNEPLPKQKEILNKTFEEWRGDLEQIDDVCVIGVRV